MTKKIFIGLSNVASQINDLKKGFNQLGYETFTAANHIDSPLIRNNTDIDVVFPEYSPPKFWFSGVRPKWLQKQLQEFSRSDPRKKILNRALKECDTFFFMWKTFTDDLSDLPLLKSLNKKIIVMLVGDDIYWPEAGKQDFINHGLHPVRPYNVFVEQIAKSRIAILERRLRHLRMFEKYADLIFTGPALAQLSLRPYYRARHIISADAITENCAQSKDNPLVIYAPSNDEYKGTKFIEDAIARLKSEHLPFRIKVVKNLEYSKALQLYSEADILIGEMFYPGGGKQQREALAAGTVVITNHDLRYPTALPEDTPFIHANHKSMYEVLKNTILDYQLRKNTAPKGRPFIEKHNTEKIVCERILKLLAHQSPEQPIIPTFLRLQYIPFNYDEIKTLNYWTHYVSDCHWYENHVKPGERARLIF